MSKKFFVRLLVGIAFLVAAVLYLLSVVLPDTFGFFSLAWAGLLFTGVGAIAFLLYGFTVKNSVTLKKLYLILGGIFLVLAVLCLVSALALPKNWILPMILVIAALVALFCVLATGGKNWDEGDNQKIGYKNYYQRKAEEEKNKKDEDGNN